MLGGDASWVGLLTVNQARLASLRVRLPVPPLGRKLTDRRRDYESLSVGSTPTDRTMYTEHLDCGCITINLWQRGQHSSITKMCPKCLAEAELEQHQPPTLENGGSNPPCESTRI